MRSAPPAAMTAAIAGLLLSMACGDGDGTGPSPDQLADTWSASSVEFVSVADPGVSVEVVSQGATLVLTLSENGMFSVNATYPGETPVSLAGSWSTSGEVLSLSFTSGMLGEWEFDMSLSGNTLELGGAHSEYDVDGDDQDEEVIMNLVLTRVP